MKLKIVHVSDLIGLYFNIPDYQRGYRWESKQIEELLNDLLEFGSNHIDGQFYCLQPLVVVENKNISPLTNSDIPVFDVIDGQQRLTTLFLIMNYLRIHTYHLRYERASIQDEEMSYTNGELIFDELSNLTSSQIAENPDCFYLSKAKSSIEDWFKSKEKDIPGVERIIWDVIQDKGYRRPSDLFYESDKDNNEKLKDARFIWYNASNNNTSYKDSIDIFKRLNYGKTSLTAAELIKALLFQCDIYSSDKKPEMKQVAFRMSTEWDGMEKKLQDKFMWSMLKPDNYDKPSHIDIVLSYVAKQLVENEGVEIKALKKDKYYDYLVFNKYIEINEYSCEIIEKLWTSIQDVFAILKSWYEDLELYHLIGLNFMLGGSQNVISDMEEIKFMYETSDREDFIDWLKEKIGSKISLKNKLLKNSNEPLSLDNIYYGDYNNEIINILLTYNVTLYIRHKQEQQRFPFYFCKSDKYTHSLEHIHPQHLHNEDIDFMVLCQWFMEKREALSISNDAVKNSKLRQAINSLDPVLGLTDREIKQEDNEAKQSFKSKAKEYESNKASYNNDLNIIDKYFDELADISELELHSLSNMALVDKNTNAALGNGLLNKKRRKLQMLSKRFEDTNGKEGAISFIGTWKIFNKEYSTESSDTKKLAAATNLNYWTKLDRENYIKEITEIYNEYVK